MSDADSANVPAVGSQAANAEAKKAYKNGVEYGHAGLYSQAAELFERAIKLKPDYADAYRSLGHAYFDLKDYDKAVESFEHALTLNPSDKEARKRLDEARTKLAEAGGDPKRPATNQTENATGTSVGNALSLTKLYRVGPGDVLDITVGDSPAEATTLTVTSNGMLTHPKIAEPLKVVGLTLDEISMRVEAELKRSAPTSNQSVSVAVNEYVSHVIMVSGLVKEPGAKIIRREAIPLSVVIADAQALPEAERISIARSESGETFTVNMDQPEEMNMLVRPGDVITVQSNPKQFFYVTGEINTPGEKAFRRGLTLTQALIIAGGTKEKSKEARIARDDGRGFLVVKRFQLKEIESGKVQDPLIQAGDRITVVH